MSTPAMTLPANGTWALWKSQLLSVVWMELRKNFITKRGFWIYLLALAPAVIVWTHSFVAMNRGQSMSHDLAKDTMILAVIFQAFFLAPGVFFGCVGIFTYLFRGEVVERSLHYYFLAPVRREVLVAAKYIAGAVTAVTFFGVSAVITFIGMYAHFPQHEVAEFLSNGNGYSHLFAYLRIIVLACLAWGAVFLWMGIRWRNPIVPSVAFLIWETINLFLPAWLRKFSILHYLQSMNPVQADMKSRGMLIGQTPDPVSTWVAVLSLLIITAAMLALSVRELKRSEISYSSD